jgi:cellulose biosynthesis protein BcsQ
MKTIGFSIQKGGTGKTSIAGNVGHAVARRGGKTLLVDGDPQGSLTSWFLTEAGSKWELSDFLQGEATLSQATVEIADNLHLLQTFGIGGTLGRYSEGLLEREPFVFHDLNEEAEKQGFDMVIYDLSPGKSRLERSILLSVDEVITPLIPEYFSVDGVEIFNDFLREVEKGFRRRIPYRRIVLNMVNARFRRHQGYCKKMSGYDYEIYELPQDAKISEAQTVHKSIFDYWPGSKSIPGIEKIAEVLHNGS